MKQAGRAPGFSRLRVLTDDSRIGKDAVIRRGVHDLLHVVAEIEGAIGGVAIGIAIGIGYWSIARLMEAMGGVGQLPPFLAAWSPDLIFFFIGLYFFFKIPT